MSKYFNMNLISIGDQYFISIFAITIVSTQHKSNFQKLIERLANFEESYITIKGSVITIEFDCDDFWIPLIQPLLKPINFVTFNILLHIKHYLCHEFVKEFIKVFRPLSETGSKINWIDVILQHFKGKKMICSEAVEATRALSIFKTDWIRIEYSFVTYEWLNILMEFRGIELIRFMSWVFWKFDHNKTSKYDLDHPLRLEFERCKYSEKIYEKLMLYHRRNVSDDGFAKFMVDFLNIRKFSRYLSELSFRTSFGIIKENLDYTGIKNIIAYAEDDEILKEWLWK